MPAAEANAGWTVNGSITANGVPGCANSPSCLAFIATRCDPFFARSDGVEISIVKVPDGAAGSRVSFRVTGGSTLFPIWIESLGGPPGQCVRWDHGELFEPNGQVWLHPQVRWVAISATAATGLTWTLTG